MATPRTYRAPRFPQPTVNIWAGWQIKVDGVYGETYADEAKLKVAMERLRAKGHTVTAGWIGGV